MAPNRHCIGTRSLDSSHPRRFGIRLTRWTASIDGAIRRPHVRVYCLVSLGDHRSDLITRSSAPKRGWPYHCREWDRIRVPVTVTTIIVGIICVAWVFRFGYLVNFISGPVFTGFASGAGLSIIPTQLGTLFSIVDSSGRTKSRSRGKQF
ncbi:SulP family inorganic anion transporter [Haladaptatus sp. W1]|uniref:SulP family inorganic anion transporter n=1 Tax=Haladaptatus sp. W1 TaxID=1897478 RepID=UPI0015867FEF|nr:SulP family inorganic anion transporter [Haladaptatus sp. W1]